MNKGYFVTLGRTGNEKTLGFFDSKNDVLNVYNYLAEKFKNFIVEDLHELDITRLNYYASRNIDDARLGIPLSLESSAFKNFKAEVEEKIISTYTEKFQ